jgi:hypothetical protein
MESAQPGIVFIYQWSDDDIIEVTVYASNGAFSGTADIYVAHGQLSAMATELAGFPLHANDKRAFTLGTFDPKCAGGGVSMVFRCTDRSGHACADIVMESADQTQSVTLSVPVVPHAVDRFVRGLAMIELDRGRAVLPIGTLQTRWAIGSLDV